MLTFWFSALQNSSDVKWVDGGKPIFKVSTNVLSTVYTQVSRLPAAPSVYTCGLGVSHSGTPRIQTHCT